MLEVCISTYVYRICSFDVFPTAVIACWSFTCVIIRLWSLLTHQQLFTQNRRDVKCFLLETVPLIRCLLLQHDMDVLLTGPFVGILKMVGCHALPIPANRALAVSPPAGKLNCSSHMSDKMGGAGFSICCLFIKQQIFVNIFPVFSCRVECGEHVLCVFWWGHHCSAAQWMWDTQTHEADREDCRYLCKCIV